jgi:hypothetical protein
VIDFTTTQCLLFPEIFAKPAVLQFDQRQGSSDGGAILLKAADRRYGLIGCLAGCLRDKRQAGKVDHPLKELLAQRVFSIACGYPDANDSARLQGVSPGGDIMIHGVEKKYEYLGSLQHNYDRTEGCIALTNPEIEEFARLVPIGTPIEIKH